MVLRSKLSDKTLLLLLRQEGITSLCCLHGGGRTLLGVLALVLAQSLGAALGSAVKNVLPVLVHLELDDDNLAGVDAHIDGGTVSLLPLDPLDVNPELLPVALHNLADLLALVVTPDYLNLIIFTQRHRSDSILGPELLGERRGHQTTPDVRRW